LNNGSSTLAPTIILPLILTIWFIILSIQALIKSPLVTDRRTKAELYRGSATNGLYSLPLHIQSRAAPRVFTASLDLWHQRLGHANLRAVK
ncbi:unnamed protein product, partial [Linum tenue]